MVTLENLALTCQDILRKRSIRSGELVFLLDGRRKNLVDFLLIDIREPEQHQNLPINGTDIILPISKLHIYFEILEELRHINFVLYCTNGGRTSFVMSMLEKMGYFQATQLKGGILDYLENTSINYTQPVIF